MARLLPAALNVITGGGTLVVCLLVRDSLPLDRRFARIAGLAAVYGGLVLVGWAALHLRRATGGLIAPRSDRLVTTGPYRWLRHPVYLGSTLAMIGVALAARSAAGLLVVLVLFLPSEIHRARAEERALAAAFGTEWDEYAVRTPAALPFMGTRRRIRPPSNPQLEIEE